MSSIPSDPQSVTTNEIDAIRKQLAEIGRSFQPQFIEMVSCNAFNTVIQRMKDAGIEEPVFDLLYSSLALRSYAGMLKAGKIDDTFAMDIVDTLPVATRLIWELGGEFTDGESGWRK